MDTDLKRNKSDENSIEEDIEEVITAGSSPGHSSAGGDDAKKTKINELFLRKQELFDIDPGGSKFSIDDKELSGGQLAHFQPATNSQIPSRELGKSLKKTLVVEEKNLLSLSNQSTENDVSELNNESSNAPSQLYTRSLELNQPPGINFEDRKYRSLDHTLDFIQLIDDQSATSVSNRLGIAEFDNPFDDILAPNHTIDITFNAHELSSLDPNIDINNESEMNRILEDTLKELPLIPSTTNSEAAGESDDDVKGLKAKILSFHEVTMVNDPPSTKDVSQQSSKEAEDEVASSKQMERISCDFTKEALEDITEESEKVSALNDIDHTSNDFDSIISLNMIQMLESKIKDLQDTVAEKNVCLASLNMQLDSANRRESYGSGNNDGRDSLKELPPSGRDSCSLATTSTEYRTIHEDYGNRALDFHSEIIQRDLLIEKLTDSLQQSMHVREQLQSQSEKLNTEVILLRKQLTDTLDIIKKPFWPRDQDSTGQRLSEVSIDLVSESDEDLDRNFLTDNEDRMSTSHRNSKERQLNDPMIIYELGDPEFMPITKQIEQFQKYLNADELRIFFMVQKKFDDFLSQEIGKVKIKYDTEIKMLADQVDREKHERETEINRLRQLLTSVKDGSTELLQLRQELEMTHAKEMENLRTYFEKKCADLEKQYSEEVFSQKSLRNSHDSNSDISDQEILPDEGKIKSKESTPRKRARELLYASPTHRQMTPTTLSQNISEALNRNIKSGQYQDKDPEISVDELKSFYQEKIREINKNHEDVVRKLNEKIKIFEMKYADDDFLALLSETTTDDNHWPPELILLREKFTAKSQLEIAQLQIKHEEEMSRLKLDYEKQLNRKLKRNSTFDLNRDLDQIVGERENLRELSNTFRWLLFELAKCISACDDDLNNTLLEELQRHGVYHPNPNSSVEHGNPNMGDDKQNDSSLLNESANSNPDLLQTTLSKKLRFVPDVSGLLSIIEDPSLIEYIKSKNHSFETFNLTDCLERLKTEANYLLELSENLYKKKFDQENGDSCEEEDGLKSVPKRSPQKMLRQTSLNENLLRENQVVAFNQVPLSLPPDISRLSINNESLLEDAYPSTGPASELNFQVHELRNRLVKSEGDRQKLQRELEITINKNRELGLELTALRDQLEQCDSFNKEVFCESYGIEQLKSSPRSRANNKSVTGLSQLQDKARSLLGTPTKGMNENTSLLLQLIEEFCREGDKVIEEGKQDREDLQAQVEQMEQHIKELTQQVDGHEENKQKLETELKASIDKIFVLREIISELETQNDSKALNEHVLNEKIKELQLFISKQNRSNDTLQQEVESLKTEIGHGFQEKIAHLEEQLSNSRPSAEQAVVLKQIIEQLRDIETMLDQKTKTLESLHQAVCSNSCSTSPSEDVSVPPQVQALIPNPTPQASPVHTAPKQHSLPIDEVQRVFEKLTKHTRVEEAAIKRIRDLEMQVFNIKTSYSELQHERDLLQERMSEQMLRISSLQSKLDEQRHRAEELQRQGTSDLTIRIHDLQNEVLNLKETLCARDKQIINLKNHLEQSKAFIDRQEAELALGVHGDRSTVEKLEAEVKSKTEENKKLKERIKNEMINKLALPDLMETMLADKNEEIDHLKEQLQSKAKELQGILEINLSQLNNSNNNENENIEDQVEEGKLSARTLSDIVSFSEYDEPDVIRRAVVENETPLPLPQDEPFGQAMGSSKCATANLTEKRTDDLVNFGPAASLATQTFDQPNFFPTAFGTDGSSLTPSIMPRQINFSEFIDDSKVKQSTPKIEELHESDDVKDLRNKLQASELKFDNLKITLENLETEKKAIIDKLEIEIAAKTKLQSETLEEKAQLENTLLELEDNLKSKEEKITKLLAASSEETDRILQLETEIQVKISEIHDLKSKISKLTSVNQSLCKKTEIAESLSQQIQSLTGQIDNLNKLIEVKDEALSKQEKIISKYEYSEKCAVEQISKLERQLATRGKEDPNTEILENELGLVRKELSEKALLYEKCLLDIEDYKTRLDELISNKNLSELNQRLIEEKARCLALEERNSALESELEKLRSQNSDNSKPFSLEEIAQKVEKELNYSAQLDSNILKAIESEEENNFDMQTKTDEVAANELNVFTQLQALQRQLDTERANVLRTQEDLRIEKQHSQDIQQQDASIIDAMRHRLEAALEKEHELHQLLDEEREKCERLSTQISVFQRSEARRAGLMMKSPPESPRRSPRSSDFESELAERLKNEIKMLTAQNEREKERSLDLQKVLERERSRFETELLDRIEYSEKLKREMDKISREKEAIEEEVGHLQERLVLSTREIDSLEARISTLQETETRRAQRRGRERVESTQSAVELQELKGKVVNLESERDHLTRSIAMLRGDIERGAQREVKLAEALASSGTDNSLPDQFMQKLKEMNVLLIENKNENQQMMETLQYLTEERRLLQKKCDELELGTQDVAIMATNFNEMEERANHLFGKYLRVESHRKALVHQKRYLLIVLQTYQENENKALALLNGNEPRKPKTKSFKSAALVIVAIQRMRFIVKRWQAGKRIASKSIFKIATSKRSASDASNSNWTHHTQDIITSGSPPCRDKPQNGRPHGLDTLLQPLQSPGLIRWKKS